jgi:4-amino-4-deoxy-L-arabinose transferase-like glycosyltransferase
MSRRTYVAVVGAVLAAEAALLTWNAWRFDWLRGYDAFANDLYATVVATDLRLPSASETGVWHTPPLWFALAGALRRIVEAIGWGPVQRPGQLLAAAGGLAVCVVAFLLARALWPERRGVHVVALVLTAATPALVRASAMYHPETLAAALTGGGLLVCVRGLRTKPTFATGAVAGALLGLAALTRAWALPVLCAALLVLAVDAAQRRSWGPVLALAVVPAVLVGPWLVNQQVAHGSALAFNRPAPAVSLLHRRPASFYVGLRALDVFDHPVTPRFRNEFVPHLYADWWGDWALTWDTPPPPAPGQLLEEGVVGARVRQDLVGVVPTLLALAGLVALGLLAVARRSLALALLPLSALALAAAYLLFAVRYPSTDGDTIKATYLLAMLPCAAVGAAFVVETARPQGRGWAIALGVGLAILVAVQLPFLVL